jgi:hypothetical protein
MSRIPHQLITHLDWHPDGKLEIRYDYPFSQPHPLWEQVIRVPPGDIPPEMRESLVYLRAALSKRYEVVPVRFPHQEILPTVQEGVLTVVARDQRRSLPVIRLYYCEMIAGLSNVEKQVRMEASDFAAEDLAIWNRLRQWINAKAWDDYKIKTKLDT